MAAYVTAEVVPTTKAKFASHTVESHIIHSLWDNGVHQRSVLGPLATSITSELFPDLDLPLQW